MHERIADILDIVLCTILAALCLQTGVRAVVRDDYEVRKYTSSYSEKNTTQKYTPSEKVYGAYDGAVTREELVIMTQVQDYEMYGPHTFTCRDVSIELNPGYEAYESANRAAMWNAVAQDAAESAYQITYDFAAHTYRIQKE